MKNSAQGLASGSARTLPRSVVALLAIATATSVAVAYYSQPLLEAIGTDLGIPATVAPLIVTLTQLGFAASLFLILPLGDMLNRRRLIVGLSVLSALVLGLTALAPTGTWVLWLSPLVGAMAVVAQLLVALTATLAPAEQRGRVVGTVMSGLLIGILLARTAAGLIADLAGWRAVYVTAATSMLAVAAALARRLPSEESAGTTRNYIRLLGSVLDLVYQQKVLRTRMLFGAIAFAQFSVLWTSLTSLLSGEPYGYSEGVIGVVRRHRRSRRTGCTIRREARGQRAVSDDHTGRRDHDARLVARTPLRRRRPHRTCAGDPPTRLRCPGDARHEPESDIRTPRRRAFTHHLGVHDRILRRRGARLRSGLGRCQ
ncbi:hypothetical protein E3G69_000023 [Mycobacteroides abscessus]|nr:hypothetical protein [Mycobacteroides abscessus]QOF41015.1 hypothetical protein E3G69_000023 [Mycobacteroides abscessus]QOF45715.1 hypothetical protein E3G70_000023 [Mycobacteroides abscessus]